jgi:predicted transcriptional regulator
MLKFPDDTQVGLNGLDDIMAELYAEDMTATDKTAEEIIKRLEEKKNYIPDSERVRREYVYALLREYRKYVKDRSGSGR